MPSTNDRLADAFLTHAVYLERIKAGFVTEAVRQLGTLERALVKDLESAKLTTFRKDRYERLLVTVRETIKTQYRAMRDGNRESLVDLADLESKWVVRAINGAVGAEVSIPIDLTSIAWSMTQLEAIVSDAVLEGSTISEWWGKQAADLRLRYADTVKQGLLRGATTPEIVTQIRGGKGVKGISLIEEKRRQAEALVRTSVQQVSNDARLATYQANKDIIKGYRQTSTLDGRTSAICQAYSSKQWDLNHRPIGHRLPFHGGCPRHFNCRSLIVSILKTWSELAGRPLKQADDQTIDRIFRQKLRDRGWDEERISKAQRRTQASMDGPMSQDLDYSQWFAGKGKAFQRETLGAGRYELYQRELLKDLSDLVDMKGNPLTVKQLRQKYGIT
jgi:SPP1 gp7 family putative phage head morphogenesis protein